MRTGLRRPVTRFNSRLREEATSASHATVARARRFNSRLREEATAS